MGAPRGYDGIAVTCPVAVPYLRTSERQAHWFVGRALRALLDSAGLAKDAIDGLAVSSFTLGADTTIALTEHFDMSPRWIEWLPTGGASGVMALRRAARAVQDGDASVVACIAGDTANAQSFASLARNFSRFSSEAVYPYGAAGPNGVFALITDNYMRRFGACRSDFGRIAVAQRANAAANPNALLGNKPLTIENYLSAPVIVEPLHLFDCVMPCAGAEAFLVMDAAPQDADGTVVAEARICRSLEPKRLAGGPLRIGAVALDVGVRVIALLDEDVTAGARVRLRYQNSEVEDRTLRAGLSTDRAT